MSDPLLSVSDLRVRFRTDEGPLHAVDGVDFAVDRGETVCIVGESGSGKTVACESLTGLVPTPPGEITASEVRFKGRDLFDLADEELAAIRGREIAYVFQNPQDALNPVYTVGWQVAEAVRIHHDVSRRAARERAVELLDRVGIPDARARVDDYPHEFSGGMKQRVAIAMALACRPALLIADEPTTALDVTVQAQILRLLADLQDEFGMGLLFVTHDLGVVAEIADAVVVMYAGKVMERGRVGDVFAAPAHPYTQALLDCLPGRGDRTTAIGGSPPSPTAPPAGCRFHPRCPHARTECTVGAQPALESAGAPDHGVSCVYYRPGNDPSTLGRSSGPSNAGGDDGGDPA